MNDIRDRSPISKKKSDDTNSDTDSEELDNVNYAENNSITMSTVNYTELNIAKETIPPYEGGSKNLSYFIQQCDKFIVNYRNNAAGQENCTHNKLIYEICCSKLIGAARDTLVVSNCTTWTQVKEALLTRFGDQRNETLLENDLITCFQLHNETYDAYYERIKSKLQHLLEHVSLREVDNNIKIYKTNTYNLRALATFQAGLLEPYRTFISYKSPVSLEDCLVLLRNHDNHKQQVNFLNFVRQKNDSRHTKAPIPPRTHHAPTFHQVPQPSANFHYLPRPQPTPHAPATRPNFPLPNRTPFPSGPVNVFKKPAQSVNAVNANNFGKNQTNNAQSKLTPMSVSTTHTARPNSNFAQRFNQGNNFFRSTGPRDIIVEELFNVENQEQQYEHESFEHTPDYTQDQSYYYCENEEVNDENFQIDASEPSTST